MTRPKIQGLSLFLYWSNFGLSEEIRFAMGVGLEEGCWLTVMQCCLLWFIHLFD